MNLLEVTELNEVYKKKAEEEEFANETTMNIWRAVQKWLYWYDFVGTDYDKVTDGEFTRRFEDAEGELKALIESN